MDPRMGLAVLGIVFAAASPSAPAATAREAVYATGNEWLALPEIRAHDAALVSFNVLSWRDRGLLEVRGASGAPALAPRFEVDGKSVLLSDPAWRMRAEWIPEAHQSIDGLDYTITYCAPQAFRAAFVRLAAVNHRTSAADVRFIVATSFGSLARVTYTPVALRGERRVAPAPWVGSGETYSFVTDDTHFSWSLLHPTATGRLEGPPASEAPSAEAVARVHLAPGESGEALFVLSVGTEEFSSAHAGRALRERLDRAGAASLIAAAEAWCRARSRTTGRADLDRLLNRNLLYTRLYAWGRTLDTEQLVGVTSRSPRYYVAAAYWDRDALLWSLPGLLDADPTFAREALGYALGVQRRNVGTHSRFIDGTVLEDGFQLDEAAAPLVALGAYLRATGDAGFVRASKEAIDELEARLGEHLDASTGLYESLQDAQDEYQRLPFITYDNVLVWRAFQDVATLRRALHDEPAARVALHRADALKAAILAHMLTGGDGASRFVAATDGRAIVEADVPPGSLLRLPSLGFLAADHPRFVRTLEWLHSGAYAYSHAGTRYGLPGSARLPFTPVWTLAAELGLKATRERALSILLASPWDSGIATEGIDPESAQPDAAGHAFATAAGDLAHAICENFCTDSRPRSPTP
jgi:hypothetical protein